MESIDAVSLGKLRSVVKLQKPIHSVERANNESGSFEATQRLSCLPCWLYSRCIGCTTDRDSPLGLRNVQGKHLFRILGESLVHNSMTAMLLKLSK